MEIGKDLCNNEVRKVGLLIVKASELGMDVGGYGFADVNLSSGNVYLWLEDYPFTLFIGLGSDDIYASWQCPEDGHEVEIEVEGKTLTALETWANDLQTESEGV